MRTPKFLNGAHKTAAAKEMMNKGTKFMNRAIPDSMTSKDMAGCMVIAHELGWSRGAKIRLHGIYNRKRSEEERSQIK